MLRFGMFVKATFHGLQKQLHATVPATAVLHLHDRDWVYAPDGTANFSASKWWVETCCRAACRRSFREFGRASNWYRTPWCFNPP